MVSHICLFVELGPICNSITVLLCLKSCEDHIFLKSYNGGLLKNNYQTTKAIFGTLYHVVVKLQSLLEGSVARS